jgi:chemotaxis protein CheY-P-specific phosphatase CheC
MEMLETTDLQFINKLIKGAFALSNVSVGKMINHPVRLKTFDLDLVNELEIVVEGSDEKPMMLARTNMFWDKKCVSFVIISAEELERLYAACISPEVAADNSSDAVIMKNGFISEVINILTSSFITELSDSLDLEIYGNIPDFTETNLGSINQEISEAVAEISNKVLIDAILGVPALNVEFNLIWIFEDSFLEDIQKASTLS